MCVEQGDSDHQPAATHVQLVRGCALGMDGTEYISSWHDNSANEDYLHLEEGV